MSVLVNKVRTMEVGREALGALATELLGLAVSGLEARGALGVSVRGV